MAYKNYDKLWRSELYKNDSAKERMQDINLKQLKVNDTHKKEKGNNKV